LTDFDVLTVTFDDADPLGELYAALYPNLDVPHKLMCFKRICIVAVRLHRYSVMEDVRIVYGGETDPTIKTQLLEILDSEDGPPHVVYGRGVIPGRWP
jgi:hypothetical protein